VVRKAAMSEIVAADRRPGLLAYADGVPVGWVAMAAKDDYEGVARSKLLGSGPDDHEVFAITCFYVDPAFRGDGVSSALLDGAIAEARSRGAAAVEAYPKSGLAAHAAEGGRAEENFSFMGRLGAFEQRGFEPVRTAGPRTVMRLVL
jgi:GNAT superfamily N-acetyltransferase